MLPVIPEISPALCTGCRECLVVCRPQALALVNGIAVVAHPELCEYDGGCEPACPAGAIALPYLVVFKEISGIEAPTGIFNSARRLEPLGH